MHTKIITQQNDPNFRTPDIRSKTNLGMLTPDIRSKTNLGMQHKHL
jgi:hypothetical protein